VVTAEDVLEGKVRCGTRVVIADQQNYMKGMVTAEFLADQEKEVTLVMPLPIRYISADTLVLSYWRKADTRLYDELRGKVEAVHKIGDALSPRRCINAIYEGHKLAMEI